MSKNIKTVSTLEFYNYGENNKMTPSIGSSYKVKVSDKEGNIITIEKDDALYACVRLSFDSNTGILQLLDAAHDDSVLAEIEMPNADYIYNCRFDEELNSILFDVKALYGNETSTIELDVESLVELYEAGQGIEIGEKNEETGRKPISIKLAEGESILHLSDDGLGIDEKVITEDELEAAISGKADTDYVNELLSGLTGDVSTIIDRIEAIEDILGTDIDDPSIDERIDSKADLDEFNDLEDEVGEIETNVNTISGTVQALDELLEEEKERALSAETELNEKIEAETTERKTNAVAGADYDSDEKKINFINANNEVIDSIDATDFIKDGMVDSVELVELSGDTYLRITWNTDSGKEVTDINIGDIFDADNYYNKAQIDEKVIALQDVDTQQWNGINGEITRAMGVESQLWGGINGETTRAQGVEGQLWDGINGETTARETADDEIRNSIAGFQEDLQEETEAREAADEEIRGLIVSEEVIDVKVAAEVTRAQEAEATLQTAIDNEATARQNADLDLGSKYNNLDNRITGFEANLQDETNARLSADTALENAIAVINDSYASKDYVDGKTAETFSSAVSSAVTDSKDYTNEQVDTVETELKHYCDTGHTELQEAISANATRINAITNWNGQGDYHDDGNGILDVLHKEFHELVDVIDPEAINRKFNTISGAVDANTAAIAAETNLREQADGALDGKIDSFYEEYQAEIQSLQDQIDELKRIISGDTPTPTPTGDSVHYGHEYVDLGLPSGTKWAKMNVGAASETAYGNYYQYGKGNAIYNSHASNYSGMEDPLASSADTATQAWGGDWHTPTKEQCDELMSNTNAEWINVDGVWGAKLTSLVYGNTNYIFIPAAGNMYQDEIHNDGQEDGSGGAHVSVSTPIAGDGLRSYVMTLGYGFKRIQNVFTRAHGLSVRPVFED